MKDEGNELFRRTFLKDVYFITTDLDRMERVINILRIMKVYLITKIEKAPDGKEKEILNAQRDKMTDLLDWLDRVLIKARELESSREIRHLFAYYCPIVGTLISGGAGLTVYLVKRWLDNRKNGKGPGAPGGGPVDKEITIQLKKYKDSPAEMSSEYGWLPGVEDLMSPEMITGAALTYGLLRYYLPKVGIGVWSWGKQLAAGTPVGRMATGLGMAGLAIVTVVTDIDAAPKTKGPVQDDEDAYRSSISLGTCIWESVKEAPGRILSIGGEILYAGVSLFLGPSGDLH